MKKYLFISLSLVMALSLSSCKKEEASYDTQAVVTVKGTAGDQCYFQVDETTVAIPENYSTNPFNKEVRAITLYKDKGVINGKESSMTYHSVRVQYIDSIRTKSTAPNLGKEMNDKVYGNDPIDIYKSFMTVVEDGYVTLRFCAKWGTSSIPVVRVHTINLVRDTDSSDPYTFELRHNYCNDVEAPFGYYRNGVIAFNIKDILAKETKSSYDITIKYEGEFGSRSIVFHYKPGTSSVLGTNVDDSSTAGAYFE